MTFSLVHTQGRGGHHVMVVLVLLLLVRGRAMKDESESFGTSRELLQSSPTFAYTNIRYESSTPVDHYDNFGKNPILVPGPPSTPSTPSSEGGGLPILDRASTANNQENPFVNQAATAASPDLNELSKEELEKRKDMLLSLLEQTNTDLATIPPSPAPPPKEEDTPLISTFQTRSVDAPEPEYVPQKSVPDNVSLLKALEKRVMGKTDNETPQVINLGKAAPASSGAMAWNNAILIVAAFMSLLFRA